MPHSISNVEKSQQKVYTLGAHPLDIIERDHRAQSQICDALEAIADSLPDMVDSNLAYHVLFSLQRDLPIHRADEEDGLFPLLAKRAQPEDNIQNILACLTVEHATDESFAQELFETLETLAQGKRVSNPNMVGYMLRSFFECYRRHLNWEDNFVIPLARKRLMPDDFNYLSLKMIRHRQGE